MNDEKLSNNEQHNPGIIFPLKLDGEFIKTVDKNSNNEDEHAWNNVTSLDSRDRDFFKNFIDEVYIEEFHVEKVLKQCGNTLEILTLRDNCSTSIMQVVSKYCLNLKKIVLQLKHFWNAKDFIGVFSNMKKLEVIEVKDSENSSHRFFADDNDPFSGEDKSIFQSLTKDTKSISLTAGNDKWLTHTTNFTTPLIGFDALSSLELKYCILDDNMMKILMEKKSITHLNLTCSELEEEKLYTMNLPNLEHLDLSYLDNINDTMIISASKNCRKLKYLNISGCKSLSKNALAHVQDLKNLEELLLNKLGNVDDTIIHNLKKLSCLECEECKEVSDAGIMRVILQNSKTIKHLVVNTTGITADALSCASDVTKRRQPSINLYIVASDNVVNNYKQMNNFSPFLEIIKYYDA